MFLLKKFVSSFLMPVPIGLFLFALGVYFLFRNKFAKAKFVLFLTLSWFALLSFQPISNAILKPLEDSHKSLLNPPLDVKYILVLGNGHKSNENLSITSQLNTTANNRLNEGIKLYRMIKKQNDELKLIVSGYGGFDKNSHAYMQSKLAQSLGVDFRDIIKLDSPKDTRQEALEVKKLINKNKLILVTSASHMKRSMLLFKKQGLDVIAAPTNHLVKESKGFSSYFSASNLYKVKIAFHEYLGLGWAYIRGMI
jgi:uncharacterized SAM-binding protein YcdF (DUF218 family)